MSIHNRAIVRLLVLIVLVFGVTIFGKPSEANAFTCRGDCLKILRSCYLACLFDPACETTCDADYQACVACCNTGC
jgi:hypothetical protein